MIEHTDQDGHVIDIDPDAQYQHGIDWAHGHSFSAGVVIAAPKGYSVNIDGKPVTLPAEVKENQEITLVPTQPSPDSWCLTSIAQILDDT